MAHSDKTVLASANGGKLRELCRVFSGTTVHVIPQSELGVADAEETGKTFVENALLKARNAAARTGLPAIADDSGLEVDALNGAPGIHSARYAGEHATDAQNIHKLLAAMRSVPPAARSARFVCVVAYVDGAEGAPILCTGTWQGRIAVAPRGDGGFGYDPVFFVPDARCTAAELDPETKNRMSHRGQALRALLAKLA